MTNLMPRALVLTTGEADDNFPPLVRIIAQFGDELVAVLNFRRQKILDLLDALGRVKAWVVE